MKKYCDLHTHSYYSDGGFSPAQLIKMAEAADLSALALCDHNVISGLREFVAAGETSPVEAVPGIEFSTDYSGKCLHILALFVRPEQYSAIENFLKEGWQDKERHNMQLVQGLRQAGFSVDLETIRSRTRDGHVNPVHINWELVRQGYAKTYQEALPHLKAVERLFTPPRWADVFDTIRFIRALGLKPVLAHPLLELNEAEMREFLPEAMAAGLVGMEVQHAKYDENKAVLAYQLAEEFGLLPSGGSDFHGENRQGVCVGTGRGNLRVPSQWLEQLRTP